MDNQQTLETKSHVCALSLDMTGNCMICATEHDLDHANEELSKKYVEYDKLFDEAYQIRIERDHANGELANALKERDEARKSLDEMSKYLAQVTAQRDHAETEMRKWMDFSKNALGERDEAKKHLKEIEEYGTDEINAAIDLRRNLAQALVDLDDMQYQRDEARELHRNALREREATEKEVDAMLERAQKAECERDEAREALKHIEEYGTEEINAAVDLRQKLAQALVDLDNMQDQRDLAMKVIKRLEQERDEAREENAKLRDIVERAIDYLDQSYRGGFSDEASDLRYDLAQLKEGAE